MNGYAVGFYCWPETVVRLLSFKTEMTMKVKNENANANANTATTMTAGRDLN